MESKLDVSAQLTELLAWPDEDPPAVFLSTSGAEAASAPQLAAVLQTIVRALNHERMMHRIARQADVDPETMLNLLLGQFEQAVARPERDAFSGSEQTALAEAGVDLSGPPPEAEDPAELTASRFAAMFGQALTVSAAAARLSVTSGRIRQRIADRTLYGLRAPRSSEWRLPLWQFRSGDVLPGLEVVLPALPVYLHPLAVYRFISTANVDLAVDEKVLSPIEWLDSGGDPRLVAELAVLLPAAA
jgi:hypothetical protein